MEKVENAPLGVLLAEEIEIIDIFGNKMSEEQAENVLCSSAARDCASYDPYNSCDDD